MFFFKLKQQPMIIFNVYSVYQGGNDWFSVPQFDDTSWPYANVTSAVGDTDFIGDSAFWISASVSVTSLPVNCRKVISKNIIY